MVYDLLLPVTTRPHPSGWGFFFSSIYAGTGLAQNRIPVCT